MNGLPGAVRAACAAIGISAEPARALEADAAAIAASPRLTSLAARCARLVFDADLPPRDAVAHWVDVGYAPGLPAFFDAVVLLSGFPRLAADHRHRGIPREVTAATLRDLELWMEHHRTVHGRWGFTETAWLARHLTGRVYQLGRLQFEPHPFELPFAVFRHRAGRAADGPVAIVVEGGRKVRADGQFADADGAATGRCTAPPGAWRSRFDAREAGWRGAPVNAAGTIVRATMDLAGSDWDLVALRGDPALAVHIPATGSFNGPLTPEACAESLRRAIPFFERHLPEVKPRLLTCTSWMLDPQLARFLPSEANLVRFQRRFRLVPVPGAEDRQTLERVFGGPVPDWTKAPRDTTLRRIIADHAAAGLAWRMGGGLVMPEDARGF
jgi:hypothetical protein